MILPNVLRSTIPYRQTTSPRALWPCVTRSGEYSLEFKVGSRAGLSHRSWSQNPDSLMNALNVRFTTHLGNGKFASRTRFLFLSPFVAVSYIFSIFWRNPMLPMRLPDLELERGDLQRGVYEGYMGEGWPTPLLIFLLNNLWLLIQERKFNLGQPFIEPNVNLLDVWKYIKIYMRYMCVSVYVCMHALSSLN